MSKAYILDACAVIALLKGESGAKSVEEILVKSERDYSVYMNKFNLLEVYYGFYRSDGFEVAEKRAKAIRKSAIQIIDDLSDDTFGQAGRLKASYRISIADSILLGKAITSGLIVVTSDHHEFDELEKKEDIEFLWIR